jgi:hypothetical protein
VLVSAACANPVRKTSVAHPSLPKRLRAGQHVVGAWCGATGSTSIAKSQHWRNVVTFDDGAFQLMFEMLQAEVKKTWPVAGAAADERQLRLVSLRTHLVSASYRHIGVIGRGSSGVS